MKKIYMTLVDEETGLRISGEMNEQNIKDLNAFHEPSAVEELYTQLSQELKSRITNDKDVIDLEKAIDILKDLKKLFVILQMYESDAMIRKIEAKLQTKLHNIRNK